MTKTIAPMPINYTYDADHARSHYLIEGETAHKNGGEFAEIVCKAIRGFEAVKDANTKFDKGSDIEETRTSIKSSGCGLTDEKLADNREDFLAEYFRRTHSTNVDYVVIIDEEVTIYNMDMNEFREFTNEFAKWDKHSTKVRIKTSGKMIKWFEERVAQTLLFYEQIEHMFAPVRSRPGARKRTGVCMRKNFFKKVLKNY